MSKLIITKKTPVVEKEEGEDPYLCVDCGKDFKWKSGTSSAGAGVNSYHCGSCGEKAWAWFNKQEEEEEDLNQCEVCDTKTKTTIKTYGCMDMSLCKNCEEEEEKTYKCSDCDAWVKPTESCCGEEEEERDWWVAHHGKIEFMTATEKVVEEIGADEWGAIDSFVDNRKVEEEPPLREWDGDMKQSIVEVECRGCNTIYKDRQCRNDCVSAYQYEYPQKGFYWKENKECFKCSNLKK
tara:strand:+ start:105 stop:815 length:711 start_codon:yes stop_codon:yes gene_type:complete